MTAVAPSRATGTGTSGRVRIEGWRRRGLDLWRALGDGLDPHIPFAAVERVLELLIHERNPACHDEATAAHVMAQNDNLIVLARKAGAPRDQLAIALLAGMIHDLNKSTGEALREDGYAVRDRQGHPLTQMRSQAEVVALNHFGDRTRRALRSVASEGLLSSEIADAVDAVVVHHGFGSSQFIRRLALGDVAWGADDFLMAGVQRLAFPDLPPPTLASVLHDLADAAQQMQIGSAWVRKFPLGFWRSWSNATWSDMLNGDEVMLGVVLGLRGQLRQELENCHRIISEAVALGLIGRSVALKLDRGVENLVENGRSWVDDSREVLRLPLGHTLYHRVGQANGESALEAKERLARTRPGEEPELDRTILRASKELDEARARQLHVSVVGACTGDLPRG